MGLSRWDQEVIRGALEGRKVSFAEADGAEVQAHVIRALLTGIPPGDGPGGDEGGAVAGHTAGVAAPAVPVAIHGARIVGPLVLRDLRGTDGAALPSLQLTGCTFDEPVVLTRAHLWHLSLEGSRIPRLNAPGLRVESDVELGDVGPLEEGGFCRIHLRGARIAGTLGAPRANLRAEIRPPAERDAQAGDSWPAIDLRASQIEGDVVFQPGFRAVGGVGLEGAVVEGDVRLSGAHLTNGEADSFNGRGAQIRGSVALRAGLDAEGAPRPFVAEGWCSLFGATIGGGLDMGGAHIRPGVELDASEEAASSAPSQNSGISVRTARIGGDFDLSFRTVMGPGGPARIRSLVDGEVDLIDTVVAGDLNCAGTEISDTVDLLQARIEGTVLLTTAPRDATRVDDMADAPAPFSASWVRLRRAKVAGPVTVNGEIGTPASGGIVLDATDLQLDGDLHLRFLTVHGGMTLRDAHIGGGVGLHLVQLRGTLDGRGARIGRDMDITRTMVSETISLRQARIGGHFLFTDVDVVSPRDRYLSRAVDFSDVQIEGELKVRKAPRADRRMERSVSVDHADAATVHQVRSCRLPFYPDWRLVEAVVGPELVRESGNGDAVPLRAPAVVGFLWTGGRGGPGQAILLPGRSDVIHAFNHRPGIETPPEILEHARDYLRFFTTYVWGDEGAFALIEPGDPRIGALRKLPEGDGGPGVVAEGNEEAGGGGPGGTGEAGGAVSDPPPIDPDTITPITEIPSPRPAEEPRRVFRACMLYGGMVYSTTLSVAPDGSVEMLGDAAIARLEGAPDQWHTPFRFDIRADGGEGAFPPTMAGWGRWRTEGGRRRRQIVAALLDALRDPDCEVHLEDASAERLDDQDGTGWSGATVFKLDGFTYQRAHLRPPKEDELELSQSQSSDSAGAAFRRMRVVDAMSRASGLRRRSLRCHPEWQVVEVAALVPLTFRGEGGPPTYRRVVGSFLWRPPTGNEAGAMYPLGHADDLDPVKRWGQKYQANCTLETDGEFEDFVRVAAIAATGGLPVADSDPCLPEGRPPTCVEPAEEKEGTRFVRVGMVIDGAWHAVEADVDAGGKMDDRPPPAPLPIEQGQAPRYSGPFRIAGDGEIPEGEVFLPSAWGPDGAWETIPVLADDGSMTPEAALILRYCARAMSSVPAPEVDRTEADGHRFAGGGLGGGTERAGRGPVDALRRWIGGVFDWMRDRDPRAVNRLRWLERQHVRGHMLAGDYRPHPYEVAALALRSEGEERAARQVLSGKLWIASRIESWRSKPIRKAFDTFFGACFDFGMSTTRAIWTSVALLLAGWGATAWLNDAGMLVVDLNPAATVLVESGGGGIATRQEMALPVAQQGTAEPRVLCGDAISEFVYAADVMVPILEFGERHRCQVADTPPPGRNATLYWPPLWRFGQLAYSVIGAIVISITLLTVSGVLRRRAES